MSVITIDDRTKQLVAPSNFANRTRLIFVDKDDPTQAERTQFTMPHGGRTLVECWISANWPVDPARENARKAMIAATKGSSGWETTVEAALALLLRYNAPTWQFVITRYPPGQPANWTLRETRVVAAVGDWAALYVAEFDTDPDVPFSIDVFHDGKALVPVDAKNLHITPIATGSSYR